MDKRNRIAEEFRRMAPTLSAIVTLDNLERYVPAIEEVLHRVGFHSIQMTNILARNKEMMQQGISHGHAMAKAVEEVGDPARKRAFFWDKALEADFREHYRGLDVI